MLGLSIMIADGLDAQQARGGAHEPSRHSQGMADMCSSVSCLKGPRHSKDIMEQLACKSLADKSRQPKHISG